MGDGLKHSKIPSRQPLNVFFNNESTFDVHSEKINLISTGSIETSNMIVKYDNVAYEWNSNVYSSIFDQNEFSNIGNAVNLKSIPYSKLLDKENTSIDNLVNIQEPDANNSNETIYPPYRYFTYNDANASYTVYNGVVESADSTSFSYTYSFNDPANTEGNNKQTTSTLKYTHGMGLYKFSIGGNQVAGGNSSGVFIYGLSSDYSSGSSGNRPFVNGDDDNTVLPNGSGWYVGGGWTSTTAYNSEYYYNSTFQGAWIKIEMPIGIVFSSFRLLAGPQYNRSPKAFKIYGSNTNTTTASEWTLLHTETNYTYTAGDNFGVKQTVNNNLTFKNYLMVISTHHTFDGGLMVFQGWYIYGKEEIQPVVIDNDYKYLAFPHSGGSETQTPYSVNFPEDTECDILIVGGGGGGGVYGGGGGGGDMVYNTGLTLNGIYKIKVGNGGAKTSERVSTENTNYNDGNPGYYSAIYTVVGNIDTLYRISGGGGAGDGWDGNVPIIPTIYETTSGYPNNSQGGGGGGGMTGLGILSTYSGNGANPTGTNTRDVAGGGGGGSIGNGIMGVVVTTTTTNGGNGGIGDSCDITDITVHYGGGGGGGGGSSQSQAIADGGIGGVGGGGDGDGWTDDNSIMDGVNGLGGGGGGGASGRSIGGKGGSGIVIIRYKLTSGSIFNGKTPGILKYLPTTTNPPSNTGSWTIQEADSVTFKSDFVYTLQKSTSTLIGNNYTTDFLFDPDTKFTPKENWGKNYTYNICASVDTKYCFVFVYFNKPTFNHNIISSNDDSDWTISDYTDTTNKNYVKITVQTTNPIEYLNIKI